MEARFHLLSFCYILTLFTHAFHYLSSFHYLHSFHSRK